MPFSAGAVAPLGSAIGGTSMGACGNRVGMGAEVEFVEKWWKRCELGKEGGWKEELKVDFAEWLGQSSNGQQGIGLGWFGQRCSNSLKAPNRTRWTRLFLLLIPALGCGWCVNVKRVEEQRYKTQAGCQWKTSKTSRSSQDSLEAARNIRCCVGRPPLVPRRLSATDRQQKQKLVDDSL